MTFALAFIASMAFIFLKASQQLNVVHFEYWRILPTSMGLAACEVFIMVNIVRTADSFLGLSLLAGSLGLGAGIGCIAAMKLHERRKG